MSEREERAHGWVPERRKPPNFAHLSGFHVAKLMKVVEVVFGVRVVGLGLSPKITWELCSLDNRRSM